ncbi:glypican-5-like isoform X2 [Erpetoichthys calabaricus]|uniref:glypican-5-like isoform X2 n=1 Tax=Erpetoichthys calabaricus TaxID=27687 RepID=UPI002234DEE1|nr:glypican-5-like isoform X2 [Erpetoichthys calabaricus]
MAHHSSALRVLPLWIVLAASMPAGFFSLKSPSCHEVKTAFQQRQIGLLKWVPDVPGTEEDLSICQHKEPTCCTRKMEDSYQLAVRRETIEKIQALSMEIKYHIAKNAQSFQDAFQSLIQFAKNHTTSLFETAYRAMAHEATGPTAEFFTDISLYIFGSNGSVEAAVQHFYNNIFPSVYNRLLNPGITQLSMEFTECLRMTRPSVNPFGPHSQALAQNLSRSLNAARSLSEALSLGMEVINITEHVSFTRDCIQGLVKMHYCSHCQGLTLIKPCANYCLNIVQGCFMGLTELDQPWRDYIFSLKEVTNVMAGAHDLEFDLLGIQSQMNDSIFYALQNGPRITATVNKVCGAPAETDTYLPTESLAAHVTTPTGKPLAPSGELSQKRRSLPLKTFKSDKPRSLKKISREFMSHMQRFKAFYSTLPKAYCEGDLVGDSSTCWDGEDVVESYTDRTVDIGFDTQKPNHETKVKVQDHLLNKVKEKLQHFNQVIQGKEIQKVSEKLGGSGSGQKSLEASGDCDDEDGCFGSGEAEIVSNRNTNKLNGKTTIDEPVKTRGSGTSTKVATSTTKPRSVNNKGTCACATSFQLILLFLLVLSWNLS